MDQTQSKCQIVMFLTTCMRSMKDLIDECMKFSIQHPAWRVVDISILQHANIGKINMITEDETRG